MKKVIFNQIFRASWPVVSHSAPGTRPHPTRAGRELPTLRQVMLDTGPAYEAFVKEGTALENPEGEAVAYTRTIPEGTEMEVSDAFAAMLEKARVVAERGPGQKVKVDGFGEVDRQPK